MDNFELQNIIKGLYSKYNDLGELKAYGKIQQGKANFNYFLTTTSGKYFLKIFAQTQEQSIPRQIAFYDFISNAKVQTIFPIKNNVKEWFSDIENKKVALFPFIEMVKPEMNNHTIKAVGELTSQLHITEIENNKLEKARYSKTHCFERLKKLNNKALQKYKKYLGYIEKISDNLPQGFVFDDICPDNIYATKKGVLGFIDPENAGYGEFLFDIAGALVMCCFNSENRYTLCQSFLNSYAKYRLLDQKEKDNLFESLIFICVNLSLFFELQQIPQNKELIELRLGFADSLIMMGKGQFNEHIF